MTEKLFYSDSHLKEFTAEVVSCEKRDGHYEVELDRTAFFPEGGGQYADTGTLDEMQVCDVQEKDGRKQDKVLWLRYPFFLQNLQGFPVYLLHHKRKLFYCYQKKPPPH